MSSPSNAFPAASGEAADRFRALDWKTTSLGPVDRWPASLRATVELVLNTPVAMVLMWGDDHIMIYNDDYIPIAGPKHPAALGGSVPSIWPEIWDWNRAILERGFKGEAIAYREQKLRLERGGVAEDVWFDLFYTPVRNEAGEVSGVLCTAPDITGQIKAREALRESEELNRRILSSSPDCIKVLDREGRLQFMNDGGLQIMEIDDFEDFRGCPWPTLWPEGGGDAQTALAAALEGRPYRFQGFAPTAKGTPRWWDVAVTPILDAGGAPDRILSVSRDITATKRIEAALLESEAKFRTISEAMPQIVWSTLPDGYHDYYNDRWYDFTGVPRGSTDGEGWNAIFHPDDQPAAWEKWRHSLATGDLYEIEYRLRHHSGVYRWVLGRALPVRDEAGQIIRWLGTCTDIEDIVRARDSEAAMRHRLEADLEERTLERDRIWSVSQDLLLVTDLDGVWLNVNPAWTVTLGWTEAELVGRSSEWLEHPDDHARTRREVARLAAGGETIRFENRFRTKDGVYRWLQWAARPDQGRLYCTARDITAEKEAAEALQVTEEALRQAQKMEAVGQLTGGIAHDFNNLLTGITGSLDLMRRRIDQGRIEDLDRFMEAAVTSANRAAGLTHRLLAFSRRQSLDVKATDINQLVGAMEDLLRRSLGEQVSLDMSLHAALWAAETDANQLESALLNLAINARDAMPAGGKLTIETSNTVLDGAYAAQHDGLQAGDYVVLCVSDTGVGMSAEVIRRAFDPFFTTKPIGAGTGLGLSMVYGFARQSKGHVRIYSELGHGTTVKLYLPRFRGAMQDATADSELAPPPAGEGETVLVVEDDAAVRLLVTEVLDELGYTTIVAEDGNEAVRRLREDTRIDLLVTDVGLPGVNGRQVAEIARQLRGPLKVLFVTGYAENAAVRGGFLEPGMEMITKPFAIDTLAAKIREMLA